MTVGILEVNLVDANGLKGFDFLRKGRNPKWNEKFKFRVEYPGADNQPMLVLKVMDHDTFTSDDYLGQTTIYLKALMEQGVEKGSAELQTQKYRVAGNRDKYRGDIQVGVTFTPTVETHTHVQELGGWKDNQW